MEIKAAVVHARQASFSIESVQLSEPRSGQILVKIVSCGVCHTDEAARQGSFPMAMPVVLGHEGSGIVEQVGAGVSGIHPGDHVVLSFPSCGRCVNCLSGRPNLCLQTVPLCFMGRFEDGTTPLSCDGASISNFFGQSSFATYAVVDARGVVPVDKSIDLRLLGPLGCGFSTGAGVVINAFHPRPGDSIVVFGTGSVGMAAIMAAKACGCTKIIAVDIVESRLQTAKTVGATHVLNSKEVPDIAAQVRQITGGAGAEFALDTTGVVSCIRAANLSIRWGGRAGGVCPNLHVEVDNWDGWFAGKQWNNFVEGDAIPQLFIPRLIELYQNGLFPIDQLITFYPFHEINQAFEDSHSGKVIKPVLLMEI